MKIQTKTALLFTGLTAGLMLLLTILVYLAAMQFTFQDFKKRLQLRAVIAAKVKLEADETNTVAFRELQRKHLELLPNQKEYFFELDSTTKTLKKSNSLNLPSSFYQTVITGADAFYDIGPTSYAGIYYPDNQGDFIVVASAQNEYGAETLHNLRTVFLACMIGGMGIVFTVGVFFSRKTFEPVRKLVAKMKSITAQNLHLRLPETSGSDEIGELTNTFNNMLDRLETAFETQNNFISNASHELSTPLTTVIGEAELALIKKRSPEEYEEALKIILQEAERLQQLTSGLLSLAQSSFNMSQQLQETIRIDELLVEVKNGLEKIDPAGKVQMDFSQMPEDENHLLLKGNRQMIRLAISNIIMNGFKYSANKPVSVALAFPGKEIQIIITDKGIGIPAKDLPHVFDPFFRASNTGNFKGHGIGLPLTATILRQHNGSVSVHSTEGLGTQVKIALPIVKSLS